MGTASAALSYGFEEGSAQGWQVRADESGVFVNAIANGTGGNPGTGGSLFYQDTIGEGCMGQCSFFQWGTPAIAPGALTPTYGGLISFDFQVDVVEATPVDGVGFIFVRGTQGSINQVIDVDELAQTNAYQEVSDTLLPGNGWGYCPPVGPCGALGGATEDQMRTVLAGATQIILDLDVRAGTGENYRLDNFSLTDGPVTPMAPTAPIPTPAPPAKKCKKVKKKKGKATSAAKKGKKKCAKRKRS